MLGLLQTGIFCSVLVILLLLCNSGLISFIHSCTFISSGVCDIVPEEVLLVPPTSTCEASPASEPSLPNLESTSIELPASSSSDARVRAVDISPLPKCQQAERRKRRAQRVEVLTSSPYKKLLVEKAEIEKKRKEKVRTEKPRSGRTREDHKKDCKPQHKRSDKKRPQTEIRDTTPCGACGGRYCDDFRERNGKKWIECSKCLVWFHNECQGLARPPSGLFTCIACEN